MLRKLKIHLIAWESNEMCEQILTVMLSVTLKWKFEKNSFSFELKYSQNKSPPEKSNIPEIRNTYFRR
jgi:hypothetical protein